VSSPGRRRYRIAIVAVLAAVVVLIVAGGVVQLTRPLPSMSVTRTLPATYTIPGPAPQMPWPDAGQASVEVLGVGSLGSSGRSTPMPIASAAKMMTAYVILSDHPLTGSGDGPTITVTAADVADYDADVAAGNSATQVVPGERLTERVALEAMLIPSADNIARMLAAWDAGSTTAFLAKMNSAAAALGMRHTHYTDPSGLEATTTSTAIDQIALAEEAIAIPAFATIVAMKHVTLPVAGVVKNYNSLLGKDGIIGIKTGSTSAAGGCLVFAAHRKVEGRTYTIIGAVLGQGLGGPFVNVLPKVTAASRKLVEAAGAALRSYTVVRHGQSIADVRGPLGARTSVLAGADIDVVGWPGLTYQLSSQVTAPRRAPAGTTVGTIQASGHAAVAGAPALYQDAIDPPSLHQRLTRRI
jgi:serine-type D-Ala-D-Ala carboxypeptidase (penicillin-binding protein 5/6)